MGKIEFTEAENALLDSVSMKLFGRTRKQGECVVCGSKVRHEDFDSKISRQRYEKFFMCQSCQDKAFQVRVL